MTNDSFSKSMNIVLELVKQMKVNKLKLKNYCIIFDIEDATDENKKGYEILFNDAQVIDILRLLNDSAVVLIDEAKRIDEDGNSAVTNNPDLSFLNDFKAYGKN